MTARAFRTGRWLEKAAAAGIAVEWTGDGYLSIRMPTNFDKKYAAARCMAVLFDAAPAEAETRYKNLVDLVYRRHYWPSGAAST